MAKRRRPSFSSLNEFINCQLLYYLNASTPRRPDTVPQARGKHVHNILEFGAKRVLEGGVSWKQGLREGLTSNLPGPLTPKELNTVFNSELIEWLSRWAPIRAEEWIEWPFEGQVIVGKIDLQAYEIKKDPRTTVLDYKFVGHAGRILSPADAQKSLQLKIYCLFKEVTRAGFVFILPTGRFVPVVVDFSMEELNQTRRWLSLTLEALETCWKTGVWAPASPDYQWCSANWCPHWKICLGKGKE